MILCKVICQEYTHQWKIYFNYCPLITNIWLGPSIIVIKIIEMYKVLVVYKPNCIYYYAVQY